MTITDPFKKFYQSDFYINNYDYPLPEFPPLLEFEPTSKCNMNCAFCGGRVMNRPQVLMDYDLYKKLIDESSNYSFFGIIYSGWGEPLLHPKIFDMIEYAHEYNILVHLYTNGLLLTEDVSKKLLDVNLDKIKISLQGASEKDYSVMRANPYYRKIVENIKKLVELRDQRVSNLFVQVSTSITNETHEQQLEFTKFWDNTVDDFYMDITTFRRLRGIKQVEEFIEKYNIKEEKERPVRSARCVEVRKRLVIHADGIVPICCSDFNREVVLGDANKQALKEIWDSEKLNKIREILARNEKEKIPFCRICLNLR